MAGDWIKLETTTPDKPEVHQIAEALSLSPDEVLGKLLRFWIWCDQQSRSGHALVTPMSAINRVTGHPDFARAMLSTGWLREKNGQVTMPNFERHNGKTAKERALSSRRQQTHRSRSRNGDDNGASVTPPLPEKRRSSSTQAATETQTVAAPQPAAAAADSPQPPPPGDLVAEIIATGRKLKIEVDETLAESWAKAATLGQVAKAMQIARSQGRKPPPEPCPASYVSPILREIVAEERKARRAAEERVEATQAQVAQQREDAKHTAPMPAALKPKRKRAAYPVAPPRASAREPEAGPLPLSWAVTLSTQVRVIEVQPTWTSDHVEHMAREFRRVARDMVGAVDWDEVFIAWCGRMDPLPPPREPDPPNPIELQPVDELDEANGEDAHWFENPDMVSARAIELRVQIFENEEFADFTARVLAAAGPGPHLNLIADETLLRRISYYAQVGVNSDAARPGN